MNTWFRKLGLTVLALTLAGALGGCDHGGGSGLLRLFFGINGNGNCNRVVITVNLKDADAIIARDANNALQCVLDANLAAAGCDLTLEGGDQELVATIANCTIPAVSPLISCLFETVDLSRIQPFTSAVCTCQTANCDTEPPVCVGQDPDPTSCEDCSNGVDDDGNGLVDCDDPNCKYSPDCENPPTSSSSSTTTTNPSTSTTTTTTSTSTTTTTTIPRVPWDLVFHLDDEVTLGALQWDTGYSRAPGEFAGEAANVECVSLLDDVTFQPNNKVTAQVLTIGIIALPPGFSGPADIARCTFLAPIGEQPKASDFDIVVKDAADPDGTRVFPLPSVSLSQLIPPPTTTTTMGPTTTTTMGPTTTTTTMGPTTTTTTGPTTTTTMGQAGTFDVTFSLDNAVKYGALQLDINYNSAPGEFAGTGPNVKCSTGSCVLGDRNGLPCIAAADCTGGGFCIPYATGQAAFNDKDAQRVLGLGWITTTGAQGPLTLTVCEFDATSTPVPGDFVVNIISQVDPDNNPISADIGVAVAPKQ